jgi:hypothetical protein
MTGLPAEHLARFVAELVDEHLDLSRIRTAYTEGRGAPPFDPRLMVRLLIYGYATGVRSSRAIERRCVAECTACHRTSATADERLFLGRSPRRWSLAGHSVAGSTVEALGDERWARHDRRGACADQVDVTTVGEA